MAIFLVEICVLIINVFAIPAILFNKGYIAFLTQDIMFTVYILRFIPFRFPLNLVRIFRAMEPFSSFYLHNPFQIAGNQMKVPKKYGYESVGSNYLKNGGFILLVSGFLILTYGILYILCRRKVIRKRPKLQAAEIANILRVRYFEWGFLICIILMITSSQFFFSFLQIYDLDCQNSVQKTAVAFAIITILLTGGLLARCITVLIVNRQSLYFDEIYFNKKLFTLEEQDKHPTFKYRNLWSFADVDVQYSYYIIIYLLGRKMIVAIAMIVLQE